MWPPFLEIEKEKFRASAEIDIVTIVFNIS